MSPALRPALLLLVAVLVTGGCGRPPPRPPIKDVAESIKEVRITGTSAFDSDDLRGGLDTSDAVRNGDPYSPRQANLDEQRIRGFYYRNGFFAAEVTSEVERTDQGVIVTFVVREGDRARIQDIGFQGLPEGVSPEKVRDALDAVDEVDDLEDAEFRKGSRFDYRAYEAAKVIVRNRVQRAGYAHAEVEGIVAASGKSATAVVTFQVYPGPLVTFGKVTISGTRHDEVLDAVKARVEIEEGKRFDPQAVTDTQTALYDFGRFSSVRIQVENEGAPAVMPVKITLVDAPRHEWRLGGGAGADPAQYEVRLRAGYAVTGWPRPLMNTRLEIKPKLLSLRQGDAGIEPAVEASAALERIDLFRPHLRGELRVGYDFDVFELYSANGPRVRLGLDSPIGKRVRVSGGWQLRVLNISELHPAIEENPALIDELALDLDNDGMVTQYRVAYFEQAVSVDLRDDPVQPQLGVYGELRAEEGTRAAGGEYDYVKLTPEIRGYLGNHRAVLAMRLRVGGFIGEAPLTQRYFSGGSSNQRGFAERQLAPTAIAATGDRVAYGGGGLIETGAEARVPIGTIKGLELGLAAFLDGADVTENFADLDPIDLHWAAGGGIRLGTPIGPVRFDYGRRISRIDELRYDNGAYHLSLGHTY
jgi:translocation and assembly module TamA